MAHQRKTDPNLSKDFLINPLPLMFYYCYKDNSVDNYEKLKYEIYKTERLVKRRCYRYFINKFKENGVKSYWMNVGVNSTCHNPSTDFIDSINSMRINSMDDRKSIIYDCELSLKITIRLSQHDFNRLKICNDELYNIITNKNNFQINKLINDWFNKI